MTIFGQVVNLKKKKKKKVHAGDHKHGIKASIGQGNCWSHPTSLKGAIRKGDDLLVGAPMLHIHELQATNHIVKNQNNHTRNRINANQWCLSNQRN